MTIFEVGRDPEVVLDVAKTADLLLFVVAAQDGVDQLGESLISMIKSQGMPSVPGNFYNVDGTLFFWFSSLVTISPFWSLGSACHSSEK